MSSVSRVESVVQSAWQRRLLVVAFEQLAIAVAIVLGGGILLLLLGTQILAWYWLCVLGLLGAGLAAYRTRVRLVGHYRIAQLLDYRLKLTDSLSTAWHLLSQRDQTPAAQYQMAYAEKAAELVRVNRAFPLTGQRLWAITGGLAAVMFGMFAVRYMVTSSLSLSQSIIPLHLSDVVERVERAFANGKKPQPDIPDTDRSNNIIPTADGRKNAPKQAQQVPQPEAGKPEGANSGQGSAQRSEMQPPKDGDEGKQQEKREGNNGTAQGREGEKAGDQGEQQAGAKQPDKEQQGNNNQQNANGLMDKMKDALSSLLAKIKNNQQRAQDQNQRSAEDQKAEDQAQAGKEQNGTPQQSAQNKQANEEQQASQGQSQSQTTEKTKAGQGRSSDQSNDKKTQEAHSGMGRQDGDKELRDAEQLKAMGKLAEIIGKRSASVTGDMMVENPSNKQQLKTEYSQRLGHHADLGGEINRDEVPLMYQQYVREYMEQVRKQSN